HCRFDILRLGADWQRTKRNGASSSACWRHGNKVAAHCSRATDGGAGNRVLSSGFPDTFAHPANGFPNQGWSTQYRGRSVMAHVASPPVPGLLLHALAKNWWLLLLRGICAILFGVLTFVWPGITLLTLVLLYGAFALADGVLALAEAVMGGAPAPRWWLALVG